MIGLLARTAWKLVQDPSDHVVRLAALNAIALADFEQTAPIWATRPRPGCVHRSNKAACCSCPKMARVAQACGVHRPLSIVEGVEDRANLPTALAALPKRAAEHSRQSLRHSDDMCWPPA